jgi:hypothetical protein
MNSQQERITFALESCLVVERKIHEARELLMAPGWDGLDRCIHELDQATTLLQTLVSQGPYRGSTALPAVFRRMKRSVQALRLQIEYASNLWRGWLQRKAGAGYTEQGFPVFVDRVARSFEG